MDNSKALSGRTVAQGAGSSLLLNRRLHLICALFFLSGFPALIYQLIWQRALFRILGVNIESVTIVVTAFMLGLGIGSIAGGRISRITRISLLPMLAIIEVLTGVFGIFSLDLFEAVGKSVVGLPLPVTAMVTLGLVIIPTLLMGATLPLLVSYFVRKSGDVGKSVGLLYFINTLGAAAACFFCIAVLFPGAGMKTSVIVAVAMNIFVAIAAMVIHLKDRADSLPDITETADAATADSGSSSTPFSLILILSAAGGFVSLSHEIFFFRTVSYATGSSPVAFAATLGCFLLGLAFGAREAAKICKDADIEVITRAAFNALLKVALLGILFLPLSTELVNTGRLYYIATFMMIIAMSCFLGMLLPLLAEIGISANRNTGMQTAKLYFANIVGSATGSIVTGFVLMEYMSLVSISVFLAISALLVAIALTSLSANNGPTRNLQAFSVVATAALALFVIPFASNTILESLLYKNRFQASTPFAEVVENRSGILATDKTKTLYGHGMYDGAFNVDPMNQSNGIVRPFALSLIHPDPANVLMIGLASGSWAQVIANNPMVKKLTVVEINPGYTQMIESEPSVASVLDNPKVDIVIDDGRRWLQTHPDAKFDAIVANTTYHFRANATNVLSADFLDSLKPHLNPGGIAMYNSTGSDRVQRTACATFDHGLRFLNNMIVSDDPIDWNMNRWRDVIRSYKIDDELVFDVSQESNKTIIKNWRSLGERYGKQGEDSSKDFLESCEHVLTRTSDQEIITDDNMGTEWRYFWSKFM